MAKRILISISAFVFLIVFSALSLFLFKDKPKKDFANLELVKIGDREFFIEVVTDTLSQARGLSGRAGLLENRGMLFIFNEPVVRSFWMVGMKFPLDIVWINGDKVVGVSENLPPASVDNVQVYSSPESADKVLEINAGLAKKFGIKAGDKIMLR